MLEKAKRILSLALLLISFVGITDETLYRIFKMMNPGNTFQNGIVFKAVLSQEFNPQKTKLGQRILFKLTGQNNLAGSEKSPELPESTIFVAQVTNIIEDNGRTFVWFEFSEIILPDGEHHSIRAFLTAADDNDPPGLYWRDGELSSLGVATAFALGSFPAIPLGFLAGYSLSRLSSRHLETPKSYFNSIIPKNYLVGIKFNRDQHIPFVRKTNDFLSDLY